MPHPLQQRVDAVQQRVSRLAWGYALGRLFLAIAAIVAVAILVDYLLRLHDPGLRWILSLAAGAAIMWAAWRHLAPLFGQRHSRIAAAQRIEARYPQLAHRLSSAIAFLDQRADDPTAGSLDLRRSVVAQTESLATDLDFQSAVDPRVPRRILFLAALVLLAAAATTLAVPTLMRIGVTRLAMPWGNAPWPARHQLAFAVGPQVLAVGDDFEVEVIDRSGELPDEVELHVRGRSGTVVHTMKRLGDRMVYRLDNVREPFSYRAVGGDDYGMLWSRLAVVSPPRIASLTVEVTPPQYARLGKETGTKLVRALAGSRIALRGTVDKPIKTAALKTASGQRLGVGVAIGADGKSFFAPADPSSPWLAEKSLSFTVEVSDETALPTGLAHPVELQVVADAPPTISWESPADHAFVTPRALVPIRGLVKDDLAIARVELRYLRPDASDEGEQVLVLYDAVADVGANDSPRGSASGQSLPLDHAWDLALIPGLAEGAVLAVRIVAEDFKPQQAAATVRRLTIISEAELENRVVQQQSSILAQLAEVLRLQRQAREQTAAIEIALSETGRLTPEMVSHLQSAELNQRQVQRLLADPQDGIEARLHVLLEELAHNRVSSQAAADRMRELLKQVRELRENELETIAHELTGALKSAQAAHDGGDKTCQAGEAPDVSQPLAAAGTGQERVIATLESLLGDLSQWDSFSRLAREVGQIRGDQQALADETDRLRLELATSDAMDAAEARTSSRQLARRQLDLARRYEKLQTRMDEMRRELGQSDPLVAGTLADALDAARRLAIAGQMRSGARELQDVRPGPANVAQGQALAGLDELQGVLSRRRDAELARTAQSLKAAAGELGGLASRQQDLRRQFDEAAKEEEEAARRRQLERLTPQAKKLAEEVRELARKLERLQARRAAQSSAQAADAADQQAQAAAGNQPDQAQDQAAAAQDLLEETKRQLEQDIQQAEQDLLREQMARLEQHLHGVIARQKNVREETSRLEAFRGQQNGTLTAAQEATLRGITGEQRLLADETRNLSTTVASAAALVHSLEGAQREMLAAADLLSGGQTGADVQERQQDAQRRLEQLREALEPDESSPPPEQEAGPEEKPTGGGDTPPLPAIGSLAELKLLKLMQEEVQRQTAELEKIRSEAGELDTQQRQRLESLAAEQGKLADMVINMIKAAEEKPEDALPEPADKDEPAGDKPKQRSPLDEELLKELEGKK